MFSARVRPCFCASLQDYAKAGYDKSADVAAAARDKVCCGWTYLMPSQHGFTFNQLWVYQAALFLSVHMRIHRLTPPTRRLVMLGPPQRTKHR